jgi:hypothetical protein
MSFLWIKYAGGATLIEFTITHALPFNSINTNSILRHSTLSLKAMNCFMTSIRLLLLIQDYANPRMMTF